MIANHIAEEQAGTNEESQRERSVRLSAVSEIYRVKSDLDAVKGGK